jgi:Cft2 family RNA processing exonuclease
MSLEKNASINHDGSIFMGKLFCCDGHSYERRFFAFSHMHSDHTSKFSKCLHGGSIYMSKPTRDLLEALNDDNYGSQQSGITKTQIHVLDYNSPEVITDPKTGIKERITFHPSEHVLGASQIEILTPENEKIVYSGDITSKDVPPNDIDTLIVDSTHGHPRYSMISDAESVERRFLEQILSVIENGEAQPVVVHAHQGKLQEIMSLVSCYDPLSQYPLLSNSLNIRLSKIYENYDFKFENEIIDERTDKGESIRYGEWPYIQFVTGINKKPIEVNGKAYSIFLHDSNADGQQINEHETSTHFATTSHADYENLINYVKVANPSHVIVDNYRTKQAVSFQKTLSDLGFNVEIQPGL